MSDSLKPFFPDPEMPLFYHGRTTSSDREWIDAQLSALSPAEQSPASQQYQSIYMQRGRKAANDFLIDFMAQHGGEVPLLPLGGKHMEVQRILSALPGQVRQAAADSFVLVLNDEKRGNADQRFQQAVSMLLGGYKKYRGQG
ncbi:hypothetical protein NFHSH190041_36980 (plasmid) [Shewanella sp. NFH-SH190041]|uniref:hypothetical protein n=1 Tax=Shewanella sp. NFH-SH190041 TaxID=2950245 RepID=UPI0021C2A6BF|nr:hypothetical protein [Shewanella sp. NFH-SH190041]BDM66246.1 hypothetical protein NFHSH190041_36980 [Shewanella sp. NFH-SH190041]